MICEPLCASSFLTYKTGEKNSILSISGELNEKILEWHLAQSASHKVDTW